MLSPTGMKRGRRVLYSLDLISSKIMRTRNEEPLVKPRDHHPCLNLARKARSRGFACLDVPSVRKKGGRCVPVFVKSAVKATNGIAIKFSIEWNSSNDQIHHHADSIVKRVKLWKKS